jgi:hypothetical protein
MPPEDGISGVESVRALTAELRRVGGPGVEGCENVAQA